MIIRLKKEKTNCQKKKGHYLLSSVCPKVFPQMFPDNIPVALINVKVSTGCQKMWEADAFAQLQMLKIVVFHPVCVISA